MIVTILSPTAMLKTSRFCILDLSIKTYIIEYRYIDRYRLGKDEVNEVNNKRQNGWTFPAKFCCSYSHYPRKQFSPQNNLIFLIRQDSKITEDFHCYFLQCRKAYMGRSKTKDYYQKGGSDGLPTKDKTSETNVRNLYCLFFLHLWCSATLNFFLSLRDEKGHKKLFSRQKI